jgi:hypothetical protein
MKSNRVALGRGLASLISSKPVPVTPPSDRGADGSSGVSAGVTTQHRNPQNHDSATTTSTSAGNAALAVAPDQTIGTASEQTPQSLGNPSESGVSTAEGVRYLPIEQLRGNPHQPRKEPCSRQRSQTRIRDRRWRETFSRRSARGAYQGPGHHPPSLRARSRRDSPS